MEVGQYKIGAIIQARLGSTRLPNKILMPLGGGQTIISQIISQLNKLKTIDKVIVASSISPINDRLEKYLNNFNVDCYRGDEDDVLSRFFDIVENNNFDYVIRLTADNPVVDITCLKKFIDEVISKKLDYCYSKNLPIGCNFEMIKSNLIIEAHNKAQKSYDREHVTPYIKRKINNEMFFEFPKNLFLDKLRLTVDYPSDYSFIYLIVGMLKEKELNIANIEKLLKNNQWMLNINMSNYQKKEYNSLTEEILEILPLLKEKEMWRITKKLSDEI